MYELNNIIYLSNKGGELMKISVIIPTLCPRFLKKTIESLSLQSELPDEIVLVLKNCKKDIVEDECNKYNISPVILIQKEGYFTNALNIGLRSITGDIILFTDDDVILPVNWVRIYRKTYEKYSKIAGISSIDVLIDPNTLNKVNSIDFSLWTSNFRKFIRPLIQPPHPLLMKYRQGVYIDKKFNVRFGGALPWEQCYSLPYRGANMSFKSEAIKDFKFPEHPNIIRGIGNESYIGLYIIKNNMDMIFIPTNPVYHIVRESLSRSINKKEIEQEYSIMKIFYKNIISN